MHFVISTILFFLWWCYLHPFTNPPFLSGLWTGTGTIFGSCGRVFGVRMKQKSQNSWPRFCTLDLGSLMAANVTSRLPRPPMVNGITRTLIETVAVLLLNQSFF